MKRNFLKLLSITIILVMAIAFCSCDILSAYLGGADTDNIRDSVDNTSGLLISSATINSKGELIIKYTDGSIQNLGKITGNDGNVDVNIEGTSNDASYATALGLRSAVSILCTHNVYNKYGMLSSASSAGAGVIYQLDKESGDAFIITNYHVVFNEDSINANGIADSISVYLYGSEYTDKGISATFVGGSNNYDIAVLRVDDCDALKSNVFLPATLADSDETYVGQSAIAIGNPDSSGISASYGIISVYSEHITLNINGTVSLRVMRIDTPVNSGNSGGGLYNEKGELIGIVNAKSSDSSLENIGYAIPSNIVKAVADNIIYYCYEKECESMQRALLGVTVGVGDSNAYLTEDGHVKVKERVFVSEVSSDGIASEVLKEQDILISAKINDKEIEITRQHQIIDFILNARVGDTVFITVERNLERITLELLITEDALTEY